jgi:hypothetical protein
VLPSCCRRHTASDSDPTSCWALYARSHFKLSIALHLPLPMTSLTRWHDRMVRLPHYTRSHLAQTLHTFRALRASSVATCSVHIGATWHPCGHGHGSVGDSRPHWTPAPRRAAGLGCALATPTACARQGPRASPPRPTRRPRSGSPRAPRAARARAGRWSTTSAPGARRASSTSGRAAGLHHRPRDRRRPEASPLAPTSRATKAT